MNIVDRAKEIILQPKMTWEKIKEESITEKDLYTSYAAILAVIPATAYFIGLSLVGMSLPGFHYRVPVASGLMYAVLQYILTLVGMYAVAIIIEKLAPYFNSRKDRLAALKVAVFSWTPALAAGVFGIFPSLSPLILLASLYSLYLFYIGLPILMETPKERAIGYFAVVTVASIVVWIIAGTLAALVIRMPSAGMMP
jgi:hypothetical protein